MASANCGRYCDANVDFVDINRETGLMCCEELEKKLLKAEKENQLPKIVIPVHLAGNPCDMKRIKYLSEEYNFRIIEDASHALGSKYENTQVGSCKHSDITVFSFHPVKIITTGEGGVATTNDHEIANNMRLKRAHGITKEVQEFENKEEGEWYYEQNTLGYNYRMNDIEAALGLSQIKRLDDIIDRRNEIYSKYVDEFDNESIKMVKVPNMCRSAMHLAIAILDVSKQEHKRIF